MVSEQARREVAASVCLSQSGQHKNGDPGSPPCPCLLRHCVVSEELAAESPLLPGLLVLGHVRWLVTLETNIECRGETALKYLALVLECQSCSAGMPMRAGVSWVYKGCGMKCSLPSCFNCLTE